MKKILSLIIIVCLALFCVACSNSSTETTGNTSDLDGLWVYEAPESQDPAYVVNFSTEEDQFTIEVTPNAMATEQATADTSTISGTYTTEDDTLTLSVASVENKNDTLVGVEQDSTLELTYQISADGDVLTLNNLSDYVKDLPSSIDLEKSNQ